MFFKDTGTIKELEDMLAKVDVKQEKKAGDFGINRHCNYCNKEVRIADAENPNENGEYNKVICDRCYKDEVEQFNREEEWTDYLNKMQALRDVGVIVLEDYREK